MNSRKIKIALTVGLLNNESNNALQTVKEMMLGFKEEVGNFLGLSMTNKSRLNHDHILQTYAIQYEHCRLDVNLVSNPRTHTEVVQGFQLV